MKIKRIWVLFITVFLLFNSCASLRTDIYLSAVDSNSGSEVLLNESKVRLFLENILLCPQEYTMHLYTRRIMAIIPKTKLVYHEFYSINDSHDEYHTMSFFGTDMRLHSEGAWILDGDYDFGSLKNFSDKEKNWEVEEIKIEKGINVEKTVSNIIKKIDSDVTYYFLDHIMDKPDMDNCNTAIKETCVENK